MNEWAELITGAVTDGGFVALAWWLICRAMPAQDERHRQESAEQEQRHREERERLYAQMTEQDNRIQVLIDKHLKGN